VSSTGSILSGGCEITQKLTQSNPSLAPSLAGKPVEIAVALAEATRILKTAKAPLISGLASDVDGLRAAIGVADCVNGYFDHGASDGFFTSLHVLQRRGGLMTTPAEVRNRADVLVFFATNPLDRLPRLFERYLPSGSRLFEAAPANRKIFLIGGKQKLPVVEGAEVTLIEADLVDTAEVALAISALCAGRSPKVASVAGLNTEILGQIAQSLSAATYGVVAWEGRALGPQGDLAVEAIYDLILTLNKTTRAAGLPLPAGGHVIGAQQVGLWQAGTSLRTRFTKDGPVYDPARFSASRLLSDKRVDAVLWVSALPGAELPKIDGIPVILVSSHSPPDGVVPDVFLPVALPAVDHDSVLFRSEGVVSIHASRWKTTGTHQSTAQILGELSTVLSKEGTASC
jgi:formylmethanofuran dehydrogenase subunit B